MLNRDITTELRDRIEADAHHFGGELPERFAIAWRAYLAALLEWNVISISAYDELVASRFQRSCDRHPSRSTARAWTDSD